MRFLHTADLHLGMCPDADKSWAPERERSVRLSLARITEICEKEEIDLLLIAGDLFHHPPMLQELREVNYLFSALSHTKVCLIAGNHDYVRPGSAYAGYPFSSNVTFLSGSSLQEAFYPQWNLVVHGLSYDRCEIREPLFDALTAPRDGRRHILLAHGGDKEHIPMQFSRLDGAGWDYVALGHIHKPRVLPQGRLAYCGSPEPLDCTETGSHGFLIGELKQNVFNLDWREFASVRYTPLQIRLTPDTTQASLERLLQERLAAREGELFCLTLTGRRDPAFRPDRESLLALPRVHSLKDESQPDYPWEEWAARPEHDPLRSFAAAFPQKDRSPLQEKALEYGLEALLASGRPGGEALR